MNINVLAASAALFLTATPAFAGPVYISQLDMSSSPLTTTDFSTMSLSDFGFDQISSAVHTSASLFDNIDVPVGGLALISQEGDTNVASISQSGMYGLAIVQQYGMNNFASISQAGNNQHALVYQNGHNNTAIIQQR